MSDFGRKNYYDMLGVPRDATPERIKQAYFDIARVYHPDSHFFDEIVQSTSSPEQTEIFKLITNAYNTLTHEEKRAAYDRTLPADIKGWENAEKPEWLKPGGGMLKPAREPQSKPRPATWKTFGVLPRDENEEESDDHEFTHVNLNFKGKNSPAPVSEGKGLWVFVILGVVIGGVVVYLVM